MNNRVWAVEIFFITGALALSLPASCPVTLTENALCAPVLSEVSIIVVVPSVFTSAADTPGLSSESLIALTSSLASIKPSPSPF